MFFILYLKTPKKLVTCSFTIIGENTKKIISMAEKKLGEYVISNDDFIRAPITQPAVTAENYDFILERESSLLGTVLAVSIWHIWEARNDARNKGSEMCCRRVADKIKAYVEMIVQNLYRTNLASRCDSSVS
jgi:hypothetical protein